MADWEIRPASVADVEAVAELRAVVLRAGSGAAREVRRAAGAAAAAGRFRAGAHLGDRGGRRVRRLRVAASRREDAHWLEHFYLAPHLQGSGIGTAVLRGLLERCDRDGTLVRLNVLRGSPARRLYERHGFTLETEDPVDVFMVRAPGTIPAEAPTLSM